jgi:uroporphyrinogen decarboxylase
MAYPGVVADLRACCELRQPGRRPVLALGLEFDMEQFGVSCAESRTDVERLVWCKTEAVKRFDYDLAEIFPDDYIEFEPLGLHMTDAPDRPTMPLEYLPMDRTTLRRFRLPDPYRDMRLPIHLEMIRRTKQALGDRVVVMGRIAAPFSTLGLVYGIDTLLVTMLDDPAVVRDNLRFFIEHQIAFGQAQLEAGADLLWLGDCVAASKFLRPEWFAEFALAAAAEVATALTRQGGLVIYHACETSLPHLRLEVQIPASAVSVGEGADLAHVREELGPGKCLTGNFDPLLLRDGTPEQVAAATTRMVRANLATPGYVFNTGEGVMRNSPAANVEAMMRTARAAVGRDRA